ncbi:ABC transporter permease [Streptomonospora salina]|uniref:Peptide/nickel transport system permease protein n=1 Tax=Streptomonospora salina TaxID=104205 RepID=A0A841EMV3_9ACTN|nr:ABC transporter permease [Streptomonospora salina]MBB6000751.1 peptide/nickel transport system permease protein [Streptomonospora salina]
MTARAALGRLGVAAAQLLALSVLVFTATEALPGDAAEAVLGEDYTPQQAAEIRARMGLDEPPTIRFLQWWQDLLTGDLGTSLISGRPVTDLVARSLPPTLILAAATVALLVPLAAALGLAAGAGEGGRLDRAVTTATLVLYSIPDFALAMLLVLGLSLQVRLLPATAMGADGWRLLTDPLLLVLPVAVLLCRVAALLVRQVRAGTADAMRSEYAAHARRLGVGRRRLLLRHVAPNALAPASEELARVGDNLFSGVLVVEVVFAVPGVAGGVVDAVAMRDVPVVQGYVFVLGAVTIALNQAAELVSRRLVPRIEQVRR